MGKRKIEKRRKYCEKYTSCFCKNCKKFLTYKLTKFLLKKMSENGSDDEQIPMADEDLEENENSNSNSEISNSVRSAPQEVSNLPILESLSPHRSISQDEPESGNSSQQPSVVGTLLDNDLSPEEQEEKARLIAQVLELQNTLDDLSSRVDNVKEENLRLRSENQVLGQYIENLMLASNVFQGTNDHKK